MQKYPLDPTEAATLTADEYAAKHGIPTYKARHIAKMNGLKFKRKRKFIKKEDIESVLNEGPLSYLDLSKKFGVSFMTMKKSCNEQGIFLKRYYSRNCASRLGKSVEIVAELIKNPQATLVEVSKKLDVSREYVSQIYSKGIECGLFSTQQEQSNE